MKLGINLSVEYHAFSVSQLSLDTLFVCSESGPEISVSVVNSSND